MIKEGCKNTFALLIHLIFYFKKSQNSELSLEDKNIKWGGNMIMKSYCFFLKYMLDIIIVMLE